MNYGLEQVDQVIARTGASYQVAKEALGHTDGDVLEAIIYIENGGKSASFEEEIHDTFEEGASQMGSLADDITKFFKDIIRQGNVTRISIVKDGKQIINIPMTAGAIGAVFFSAATIMSIIAALATGCELAIVKEDGEVINVKDVTKDTLDQVREKVKQKTEDVVEDEVCEDCAEVTAEEAAEPSENAEVVDETIETADDLYEEVKEDSNL